MRELGVIPLRSCGVNAFSDDEVHALTDETASYPFCIQVGEDVAARHRMYMIAADAAEVRTAWIRLLAHARDLDAPAQLGTSVSET